MLAYAESPDSGALNLVKVLVGLFILAATALLVAVPIAISRSRRHRQAEAVMVAAFFWGVITAGSAMYTAAARYNWSKEYTTEIESGYYDPGDLSDKPGTPWALLGSVAAAYAGLLCWSASRCAHNRTNST